MVTTEFNKEVECGNDFVAVQIIENCDELKVGEIYMTESYALNSRLAFSQIKSIGKSAAEKTGCRVGDYVLVDRLSTFGHTAPIACLKYDSVICLTDDKKSDIFPLKDMAIIEPEEKDDISNLGGVYMMDAEAKLNIGKIIKTAFDRTDEYPFEVGDRVMLTKGADIVDFGELRAHIYKKDMLICTIEDTEEK